jgi:sporulation protein YlmC with PRC-barrel domain
MTAPLTDDDVGKTVIDAEGKELGIVANVDGRTAHVDPNPSVAEHVLASVGWEGEDEEDYVVTEDMVERIDDEVVLRGEL